MLNLPAHQIRSVLCLGAHADDIEIGCGGTMLKLIAANPGLQVNWVVFASDAIRRREAETGAQCFLAGLPDSQTRIHIREFPDRFFPQAWADIKHFFSDLSNELSDKLSPDLIFTHRLDDRHQDHRVVSELTWNAFRNHWVLEYEIPKYEGDLGQPNLFVPLTAEIVNLKTTGIVSSFPSQASHPWFEEETFRSLMRIRGVEANSPTRYAEGFYSRKLVLG